MGLVYSYDRTVSNRTAARPDPKKPLSKSERQRMAKDREEMFDDAENMGHHERREIEDEIELLLNFSIPVGFDGNSVVRL